MVQAIPEAHIPVGDAHVPAAPAAPAAAPQQPSADQPLGQVPPQAPEPTVGGDGLAGAPESQASQHVTAQVSPEEFTRLQQQLQEREQLLDQIKQVAAQQQAQQREQEFRAGIKDKLQQTLKRVMDADEQVMVEELNGVVNGVVDQLTSQYQQQVEQYTQTVQQQFWQATAPGYADHLIREHALPPEVKGDLLQFANERDMTSYAMRVKAFVSQFQQQAAQHAVTQQEQQIRASGAFIPSGGGQPSVGQPIQAGTARELAPALKKIFGI